MSIIIGGSVANDSCISSQSALRVTLTRPKLEEMINEGYTSSEEKKLLFKELNGNQDQFTKAHAGLEKIKCARLEKVFYIDKSAKYGGGIIAAIGWGSPIVTGFLKHSFRAGFLTAAVAIPLGMIVASVADKLTDNAISKLEYENNEIRILDSYITNYRSQV